MKQQTRHIMNQTTPKWGRMQWTCSCGWKGVWCQSSNLGSRNKGLYQARDHMDAYGATIDKR